MKENQKAITFQENGFGASIESENSGNILKVNLNREGSGLRYIEVLELWESNRQFVDFFNSIFKRSGFNSYRWETPPVTKKSADQRFEFVILNSPTIYQKPDRETFREYFHIESQDSGVVSFPNLGGDAILVVPSPFNENANYSGLAEFLNEVPVEQQRALWKVTAKQVKMRLREKPLWVSVAGGGVAWLHVRIDDYPKYYRYGPYVNWNFKYK